MKCIALIALIALAASPQTPLHAPGHPERRRCAARDERSIAAVKDLVVMSAAPLAEAEMLRCAAPALVPRYGTAALSMTQPAELGTTPASHFRYIDLYVDSGAQPMAAYQLELFSQTGNMNVVGISGGDHPAFAEPPFHDNEAMIKNRVILAAYTTAADLPRGKTRVARVNVELRGEEQPRYRVKLVVAGSAEGKPMPADVTFVEGEAK